MFKWFIKNEKLNSKIKLSNNSSFVILIFAILKFRNVGRSTFRHSKFWPPPERLFYFYRLIPLHTQNMFDIHLTILHAPNCRTVKESRKLWRQVLGFHRLFTSEYSTHAHHDARRSRHNFWLPTFGFVVEFWVSIDWSHPNISHTYHDAWRSPHDFLFLSFPGPFFRDSK